MHQSLGQLDEAVALYDRYLEAAVKMVDAGIQILSHFAAGELALVANNYEIAAQSAREGLRPSLSLLDEQRASLMARGIDCWARRWQ